MDDACVAAFGKPFKHLDAGELVLFKRAARLANYYRHPARRMSGNQIKLKVIERLGIEKKCLRCGYDRYIGALEFHHRDPTQKKFQIKQNRGLGDLVAEARKCDLLCVNCHREQHAEGTGAGRPRSAVLEPQVAAYLQAVGVEING